MSQYRFACDFSRDRRVRHIYFKLYVARPVVDDVKSISILGRFSSASLNVRPPHHEWPPFSAVLPRPLW